MSDNLEGHPPCPHQTNLNNKSEKTFNIREAECFISLTGAI
ncbi:hypothetical protein SAMN05216193_10984 [Pseudomonas jinjuensis]|uniref:Uncharacterized protein n=1 Tax=Pseudomonas jinjuensis TaxID=198616 RepID=A0A1H0HZZ9_9PSED|nr:hypothetical protein SAMN05216193_10984 [Pseudomonas jinjuensis]